MKLYNIESSNLRVKISSLGAEITELIHKDSGHNWVWNGSDPWKRSAPVLFPIVGKLKNDRYRLSDIEYKLPQHGFARDSVFQLMDLSQNQISFCLQETPESLNVYPFRFKVEIQYTALDSTLEFAYQVVNCGEKVMYYNFGWHPAFSLPGQSDPRGVSVETDTLLGNLFRLKEGLVIPESPPPPIPKKRIQISSELFANDALLFLNSKFNKIALLDSYNNSLELTCEDAPHLGLWSKDTSKFVCIEPWWGHADTPNSSGQIVTKPSIQTLEPNGTWKTKFSVRIN